MDKKKQFFFRRKKKNDNALLDQIATVVEGLIYVSETDAPVLPFAVETTEATSETMLHHLGRSGETDVEETSFDAFFNRLTFVKDWFGEREKAKAKKFLALKELLEESLRDLKVFRVGRVRVDIYVVGTDAEGRVMGVETKAVET